MTAGATTGAKKRSAAAGVELWNSLAEADDPTHLDDAVVASIKERFGGNVEAQDGVKQAYSAYLQVCCYMHSTCMDSLLLLPMLLTNLVAFTCTVVGHCVRNSQLGSSRCP